MNKIKLYLHEPLQVLDLFFKSFCLLAPGRFERVTTVKDANVILVHNRDALDALYTSYKLDKLFIAFPLAPATMNDFDGIPEDVAKIDPEKLVKPEGGLQEFIQKFEVWLRRPGAPPVVEVAVRFDDVALTTKPHQVVVVSGKDHDHTTANLLLKEQRFITLRGLKEAIDILTTYKPELVIADVYISVDDTYPAVALTPLTAGQIVPFGFAAVWELTRRGVRVALVTETDPATDWIAAMFATQNQPFIVNGQKVGFYTHKRWDKILKAMMET